MFGQKNTFGSPSSFGTTPAFGTTAFGQQQQQQQQTSQAAASSLFGAKPSVSFGATGTSGGLFGSPANTFGQPAAATGGTGGLFGGTSTFSTPAAGTLFGGSATQAKPLFGAATTTPFGATATTTQPSSGFAFGASPAGAGLFGTQPQQQTSTTSSMFGAAAQPAAAGGGGLFGTATMAVPAGTTVKFNPKVDTDTMLKNNLQQNIQTKHQCVTAMKEYEAKSLEELRTEDYLAGRKGPAAGTQPGFQFASTLGQPQQQQAAGGLFGASAPASTAAGSIFGQTQNKPLFGGTTFGAATSAAPGTSLFGQQAQQQQAAGLFGTNAAKPLFGATTTAASSFTFGSPATSTGGLFGQQPQQAQQSLFGAPTSQPSIFGGQPQQQAAPGLFGTQNTGLAFGAQQPQQQQPSMFGAQAGSFGVPAATGFTGFGQPNASAFGGGTNLFGAKTTTTTAPTFSGFGQQQQANAFGTAGFTGFGQPSQPGMFGAQNQQKPMFSGFGAQQQPAFGTGTSAAGGMFGTSAFGAASGQSMFGAQQAKPGLAFGAGGYGAMNQFGATAPTGQADAQPFYLGTSDAAAHMQQEILKAQLLGIAMNPYGVRNILSGDKVTESKLPTPTNPLEQRRLLDEQRLLREARERRSGLYIPERRENALIFRDSPKYIKKEESLPLLPGLDSDTITFTEGFVPRKNIKKLVIKPKVPGSASNQSGGAGTSTTGQRRTWIPEDQAITTPIHRGWDAGREPDRTAVQALNFDQITPHSEMNRTHANYINDSNASTEDRPRVMVTPPTPHVNKTYNVARASDERRLDTSNESAGAGTSTSATGTSASPSTESRGVQTLARDENAATRHRARIVLTKPEYYTVPSMEELETMVDSSTGDCVVDGFTVGRRGYGTCYWPGHTNVKGLNLDELVIFRHKEVTVYPNEDERPPLGSGLNKPAQITLERVWPLNKTTHLPIQDERRLELMKYRQKLEKATASMEGEFVDYRPESGSWVFKVAHFSKYGLAEEADEEEPAMMELELAQRMEPVQEKVQKMTPKKVVPEKETYSAQRAVVDIGFSLDAGSKGLGGGAIGEFVIDEEELMDENEFYNPMGKTTDLSSVSRSMDQSALYKTAPMNSEFAGFFREIRHPGKHAPIEREFGGLFDELERSSVESERRVKRKPPHKSIYTDLHEKSLQLLGKTIDDDSAIIELSHQQQPELQPSPAPTALMGTRSEAISVTHPKREIRLIPYEKSVVNNRTNHWFDAGLFNGRRFRVGWAPMGVMMTKGRLEIDGVPSNGSIFGTGRSIDGPKEFAVALTNAVPENYSIINADLDALLHTQLDLSEFDARGDQKCPHLIPVEDTIKMLASYNRCGEKLDEPQLARSVFQLCDGLWGILERDISREEMLSRWIMEQSKGIVDQYVDQTKKKGDDFYADGVFALLTSRRIEEAAEMAQEIGDFRLSMVVCQLLDGGGDVKALWLKQLTLWNEVQADKFIDTSRMKIFMLAAGVLKWKTSDGRSIVAYHGLDWKRTLGLFLWYGCSPRSSIARALTEYESAWRRSSIDGYECAAQPLALYLESDPEALRVDRYWREGSTAKLDICYHLLRLYAERSYSIYSVLESSTWTADPFDFHMSWHLWCILRSLGLVLTERGRLDTLHVQYAYQLERLGFWQRGIFVALHIEEPYRRETLIKQFLSHHARDCTPEEARTLIEEMRIPVEWGLK